MRKLFGSIINIGALGNNLYVDPDRDYVEWLSSNLEDMEHSDVYYYGKVEYSSFIIDERCMGNAKMFFVHFTETKTDVPFCIKQTNGTGELKESKFYKITSPRE